MASGAAPLSGRRLKETTSGVSFTTKEHLVFKAIALAGLLQFRSSA